MERSVVHLAVISVKNANWKKEEVTAKGAKMKNRN